jgi:hypothetical protein
MRKAKGADGSRTTVLLMRHEKQPPHDNCAPEGSEIFSVGKREGLFSATVIEILQRIIWNAALAKNDWNHASHLDTIKETLNKPCGIRVIFWFLCRCMMTVIHQGILGTATGFWRYARKTRRPRGLPSKSYSYNLGIDEVERAKSQTKSRVRAKVEHVFQIMKLKFGSVKVQYRELGKNANRLFATCALVNLFTAHWKLLRPQFA